MQIFHCHTAAIASAHMENYDDAHRYGNQARVLKAQLNAREQLAIDDADREWEVYVGALIQGLQPPERDQ